MLTDIDEDGRKPPPARCSFHRLDVASEAEWDALAAAFPAIDVLVNNAGITGFEDGPAPHDPENASLAEWHRVHGVNTDGCFLGCRYALRAMKAQAGAGGTGSIINMSSRSGLVGIPARRPMRGRQRCATTPVGRALRRAARLGDPLQFDPPAAILTDIWNRCWATA